MRGMRVVLIAALIACAMTALCVAEEEEADVKKVETTEVPTEEPEQEVQMDANAGPRSINDYSHKDVKVTAMIPDYLGKEIPAGEEVEMVVWFSNANEEPITVHGIFAALQSSMDASRFIQNFTPRSLNVNVDSNTESSFSYKFRPSEYLTPMAYRFFSIIEYSDAEGRRYFNVLFNETFGFAEANVAFDLELIMTYLIIIGTIGGSIYGIYNCVVKKAKKGKRGSTGSKPSAAVPHDQNEWLQGTAAGKRKSSKQKKNN